MNYRIEVAGVNSLILRFSDQVDQNIISKIGLATQRLQEGLGELLIDLVPSYTTLLLTYDLLKSDDRNIREMINKVLRELPDQMPSHKESVIVELPVCYDAEFAPDMSALSEQLQISAQEIIKLHSEREYSVYAIGFSPGFGYLGELDERLRVARLAKPRTAVPQGSVAIAELNTAVYPQQTPGGWWLIGKCPIRMFDPVREPPCLFNVGDKVRFIPITASDFKALENEL